MSNTQARLARERAARERAALAQAQSKLRKLKAEWANAATRREAAASVYGDSAISTLIKPFAALTPANRDMVERQCDSIAKVLIEFESNFASERAAARDVAITSRFPSIVIETESDMSGGPSPEDTVEDVRSSVTRILNHLDGVEVEASDREELALLAEQVVAADSAENHELLALRKRVDETVRSSRSKAKRRERLLGYKFDALAIDHAEALAFSEEVEQLLHSDEPVPTDLGARLKSIMARAEQEEEETHIRSALEESVEELGWELTDDFQTELSDRQQGTVVVRDGYPELGLRLRLDPATGMLDAAAVRAEGEPMREDFERMWCDSVPDLERTLSDKGVDVQIKHNFVAGEFASESVPRKLVDRNAPQRKRRSARKDRRLDRP